MSTVPSPPRYILSHPLHLHNKIDSLLAGVRVEGLLSFMVWLITHMLVPPHYLWITGWMNQFICASPFTTNCINMADLMLRLVLPMVMLGSVVLDK